MGRGVGLGSADRRLAPRARRPRGGARRLEAHRARRAVPDRVRDQPRRPHHVRRARRARLLRRAQPRVDHRRVPPEPRPRRGVPPPGPRPRRRISSPPSPPSAPWSSPTRCSRWTATSPTSTLSRSCAPRRGALLVLDEAHAVLGPDPDLDRAGGGSHRHALEDGRRPRRLRRRPRPPHRADREPGPLLHLHDRPLPRRHRRRPRRRRRHPLPRGQPSSRRACAPTSSGSGRGTRRRSSPSSSATSESTLGAAAALLDQGMLVPAIRPPTVPPGTSRLRVALSAAHAPSQVDALTAALARL